MLLLVGLGGENVAVGQLFPQTLGLIGVNAGSANLRTQKAADSERIVAHRLGRQPEARTASQQPVLRVLFEQLGRDARGLPVRCRGDDQTLHRLDVPARAHELRGQPVEQLRVAGWLALRAEVLGGLHQARAEVVLPVAIDGHARRQRVGWVYQPFRQPQPVAGQVLRHRRQARRNAGRDFFAVVAIVATPEHKRLARLLRLAHHHRGRDALLELFLAGSQVFQLGIELTVSRGRVVTQKVFAELRLPRRLGLCFLILFGLRLGLAAGLLLSCVVAFRLLRLQHRDLFGRLTRGLSQQGPRRQVNRQALDLGLGQLAVVDTQVIDLPFVGRTGPLVANLKRSGSLDRPRQAVAQHFERSRLVVHVQLQSRGLARAIVVHRDVVPLASEVSQGQSLFRPDFDGVLRPLVNQAHDQVRAARQLGDARGVIEQNFIPAMARRRVNLLEDSHFLCRTHQEPEGH